MSTRRPTKTGQTPNRAGMSLVLGGGSLLTQVSRDLATALDRAFAELDLTAQQAALLMHAHKADSSPTQLMAQLGTDTAGMSKLIDRLEAKGLLARRRSVADRRSVLIEVTESGKRVAPQIPIIFGKITRQLFAGFTASEIAALTAMLERMSTNLSPSPHDGP
jgi:DNA-binding MarR family transcriptional regulator